MSQFAGLKALFYPPAGQRSTINFDSSGNPSMVFPADLLGRLLSANMNVTTDQKISLQASKCRVRRILVTNASISLDTAVGGVYTAASKADAVVANTQVYSALTSAAKLVDLTIATRGTTDTVATGALFLSLTTAQGAAATADIYVFGDNLDA